MLVNYNVQYINYVIKIKLSQIHTLIKLVVHCVCIQGIHTLYMGKFCDYINQKCNVRKVSGLYMYVHCHVALAIINMNVFMLYVVFIKLENYKPFSLLKLLM